MIKEIFIKLHIVYVGTGENEGHQKQFLDEEQARMYINNQFMKHHPRRLEYRVELETKTDYERMQKEFSQ